MTVVEKSCLIVHHVERRIEIGDFLLEQGNGGGQDSRLLRERCKNFSGVVVRVIADAGEDCCVFFVVVAVVDDSGSRDTRVVFVL